MLPILELDPDSGVPLYRQIYTHVKSAIQSGKLSKGDRLPATRELAGQIGLNRTTITAAYELLEADGLIRRHVGRGSFVAGASGSPFDGVRWQDLFVESELESPHPAPVPGPGVAISFATSRPSEDLFPLAEIRSTADEVIRKDAGGILQLGSPSGYPPLRQFLLHGAMEDGTAGAEDEIVITNGCQQAMDLLQRVLITAGDTVAVEDPVYPGIHHVLHRAGARVVGVPMGEDGLDVAHLERILDRERPKLLVLTPNFQNPTGATIPLESRRTILQVTRRAGTVVAENDIYADLRYEGADLPSLKQLDETGDVVQMRSFSKVAFPGLRVGWVIGPRPLLARLADAKQWCDLHTDQLSQAVLCRFAESGRLEAHRNRVVTAGRQRLAAVLAACEEHLPQGATYTRPRGGMNLWVELPQPLDAGELLSHAQNEGVSYLPGRFFAVSRPHSGSLRLSFAGLAPEKIEKGIAILGKIFRGELQRVRRMTHFDAAPAMV